MDNTNLLGGVKAIFAAFKKYAPTLQAAYAEAAKAAITNVASNYQQLFKQFQTQVLPKLRTQQALTDAETALCEKLKKESEGIQASADFEQLKSAAEQVITAMSKFAVQLAPASNPIADDAPVATRAAFYAPMPPPPPDNFPIVKNVGKGGANDPKDVRTVQKLLNQRGIKTPILAPLASLDAAGLKELVAAIERLQKNIPKQKITGLVEPNSEIWSFIAFGRVRTNEEQKFSQYLDNIGKNYDALINKYAAKYGVDASKMKSILAAESKGDANARSGVKPGTPLPEDMNDLSKKALGLMQVTTGSWVSSIGGDWQTNWNIPEKNIEMGIYIFAQKLKGVNIDSQHPEREKVALLAYNGGEGTINLAIKLAKNNGESFPQEISVFTKPAYLKPAVEEKLIKVRKDKQGNPKPYTTEDIDTKYNEIIHYLPIVAMYDNLLAESEESNVFLSEDENQVELPENPPAPAPKIELPSFPKINPTNVSIKYGIQIKNAKTPFPNSGIEAMSWNTAAQTLGKKCFYGTFQEQHILYVGEWETAQAAQNEYPALEAKYPNARLIELENGKRVR